MRQALLALAAAVVKALPAESALAERSAVQAVLSALKALVDLREEIILRFARNAGRSVAVEAVGDSAVARIYQHAQIIGELKSLSTRETS